MKEVNIESEMVIRVVCKAKLKPGVNLKEYIKIARAVK